MRDIHEVLDWIFVYGPFITLIGIVIACVSIEGYHRWNDRRRKKKGLPY
jgi:uncharacterized iron-regulated membrane protein